MGRLFLLSYILVLSSVIESKDLFEWDTSNIPRAQVQVIAKREGYVMHYLTSPKKYLVSRKKKDGRELRDTDNSDLKPHKFKFKRTDDGNNQRLTICTTLDIDELHRELDTEIPLPLYTVALVQREHELNVFVIHVKERKFIRKLVRILNNLDSILWFDYYERHNVHDIFSDKVLQHGDLYLRNRTYNIPFYTGLGEIGSVSDTGLDYKHCAFYPDKDIAKFVFDGLNGKSISQSIKQSTNRVLAYIKLQFHDGLDLVETDFTDSDNGHGTHVTSSFTGSSEGCKENVFFHQSKSKLIFVDASNGNSTHVILPPLLTPLLDLLYISGSRVFSNSWGLSSCDYGLYPYEIDRFVYLHDEMIIVFAAGNNGPLTSSITSPANAKNIISVGASQNDHEAFERFKAEQWIENRDMLNVSKQRKELFHFKNLASFSSRGPTCDGRIKPDIVSVGEFILGAKANAGPLDYPWVLKRGSSMATPELGKYVMNTREILRLQYNTSNPSAALIKNIAITTAEHLSGVKVDIRRNETYKAQIEKGTITEFDEGFGRFSMRKLVNREIQWIDRLYTATTSTRFNRCFVASYTSRERIGLVWTDPPAHIHADKILVNDLNLRVVVNEKAAFLGNKKYGKPDNMNNVEVVSLLFKESDFIRIAVTVSGPITTIPPITMQAYSLVYPSLLKEVSCSDASDWIPPRQCEVNNTIGYAMYKNCYEKCSEYEILVDDTCKCIINYMINETHAYFCDSGNFTEAIEVTSMADTPRRLSNEKMSSKPIIVLIACIFSVFCMYLVFIVIR